jgi:hypothetical protein
MLLRGESYVPAFIFLLASNRKKWIQQTPKVLLCTCCADCNPALQQNMSFWNNSILSMRLGRLVPLKLVLGSWSQLFSLTIAFGFFRKLFA